MIYYILPNLINNYDINQYIIDNCKQKNIVFWGLDCSFNYSLWNGGVNNNTNDFQTLTDYLNLKQQINIPPIRLDCANTQLEKLDFLDEHMNLILKTLEDYNNNIKISDLNLMYYIKQKYPKFTFSLSNNFFIQHNLDEINIDDFELIQIPFDNLSIIDKIKEKHKIEIILNPYCPLDCKKFQHCMLLENSLQINYSNFSIIKTCTYNNNEKQFKNIFDITNYINQGITHFSFNTYNYHFDINLIAFLLNYFFSEDKNIFSQYISQKIRGYNI